MKDELKALRKQYQERSEQNQCVICGELLEEDYEVRTVTGWANCYDCGKYYDPDGHRTTLDSELAKKAKALGLASPEDLPKEVEDEVFWECEGW